MHRGLGNYLLLSRRKMWWSGVDTARASYTRCLRYVLTNGASSKRKLGDAHLKGIGIGMEFMEQVQQDVKHGGDISQMGLNILGQSMTDAFEITYNRQHG